MNNWQIKKLGEIVNITSGTWGAADAQGTAVLRSTNFTNEGQLLFDDVAYREVPKNKILELNLKDGDILLEKSGGSPAQPVGRVVFFDKKQDENIVFGNFISRLRPSGVDNKFIFYFLLCFYKKGYTNRLQNQTTGIRNLILKKYLDIRIPIPSITVQQQIVKKLDAIRKLQELNQKEIEKAEELFESFFNSIFSLTNEWSTKKISDVAMVNPPKPKFHEWDLEKEVDFLPMSALATDAQNPLLTGKRKLKQVKTGYTCFQSDDILLAKITPCFENGKTGIFRKSPDSIGFGSTEFIVIRADNKKVVPIWIWLFVFSNRFRREGKLHMTGSAGQKRLPVSFVEKYHIPIPPLNVQQQIVEKFQSIGKYYELSKRKKESLNELFESTLNKVMKGELVN